ncbi:MAG: L-histidine N(alpha)-methyltransferase [Planctomycetota bacterium]
MTTTESVRSAVARAALEGLTSTPRRLPAALFYDAAGSALFEEITALPEYYQTRTERGILERIAPELREALGGPLDLVELGAGSSAKTEVLLGGLDVRTYVPIDVSPAALEDAAVRLRGRFPDLDVAPVVGNYHEPVDLPPPAAGHARAAFFPGSTIGNLQPAEAAALLRRVARMLGSGGALVLGVDLVKDPRVLEAAYDDAQGVTAAFNLNALRHINREAPADFDDDAWRHHAFFDPKASRIEMHLVATRAQRVEVAVTRLEFEAFDSIWTESSYKYTRRSIGAIARHGGFRIESFWTDPKQYFGVLLMRAR